jgi:acyl-coenzyme A thioesterase PaaI-like protein
MAGRQIFRSLPRLISTVVFTTTTTTAICYTSNSPSTSSSSSSSSSYADVTTHRHLNPPSERARHKKTVDGHLIYSGLKEALDRYDLYIAPDSKSVIAHATIGPKSGGHPNIVHGGLIAALLDDTFGALFLHAGVGTGFTANLSVDYKKPLPIASSIVISAKVVKVEQSKNGKSQKVYLEAVLTDMTGKTIYSEAKALFLAPNNLKYVAYLAPIFKVLGIDSTHLIAMGK